MKRALFAPLCAAIVVAFPVIAQASAGSILSQLKSIERQTQPRRKLDAARREKIADRARDLTRQSYKLPRREPKDASEFSRVSAKIWENLREQAVDPSLRGLPAGATARDKKFVKIIEDMEARYRKLPEAVSTRGMLGTPKPEHILHLRDEVARFAQEYPRALQQYQADLAIVRGYKPESRSGVYRLEQARRLLEDRALKELQRAPVESLETLASQTKKWLDRAKSDIEREGRKKPGPPGLTLGGVDPIVMEVFPNWRPGDPIPVTLPQWKPNDDGVESDYDKLKRLSELRHHAWKSQLGESVNLTLESAWKAAHLGAALDQLLGGDATSWQPMVKEAERLARGRGLRLTDRLLKSRPLAPATGQD